MYSAACLVIGVAKLAVTLFEPLAMSRA